MKFKTAISTQKDGELYIRGYALSKLLQEQTFSGVAFLLVAKRLPSEAECKLFDLMLISAAEHGVAAPSAYSARVSASVGNPLNAALAAGLLATGEHHGGAVEALAKLLQSKESPAEIVSALLKENRRLPGFGHKVYKDVDPRAERLFAQAQTLGIAGTYAARARELQAEYAKQTGKHLLVNIDGALAALCCELDIPWRLANVVFLLGRVAGMTAHVGEEWESEKPYRRLEDDEVEYTGA